MSDLNEYIVNTPDCQNKSFRIEAKKVLVDDSGALVFYVENGHPPIAAIGAGKWESFVQIDGETEADGIWFKGIKSKFTFTL